MSIKEEFEEAKGKVNALTGKRDRIVAGVIAEIVESGYVSFKASEFIYYLEQYTGFAQLGEYENINKILEKNNKTVRVDNKFRISGEIQETDLEIIVDKVVQSEGG